MKALKLLIIAIFVLGIAGTISSCASSPVDILVDKSQRKGGTVTHDLYPLSAVTPVANPDKVNNLIRQGIDRVNKSLRDATK